MSTFGLVNAIALIEGIHTQLFVTAFAQVHEETGLGMEKFLLILAIQQAVESLSSPVWGALGDVYSKRVTFLLAAFLFALASLATSLSTSFPEFLVARLLGGLSVSCFVPISHALLTESVASEDRPRAHGLFVACAAVGSIVGATWPLTGLRWKTSFLCFGCLTLAVAVVTNWLHLLGLSSSEQPVATVKDSFLELFGNLKNTLTLLVRVPAVTAIFLIGISAETCTTLLPLTLIFLQDHLPPKLAAYTFSGACVFSAIGAIVCGATADKNNQFRLVRASLAATITAAFLLFFTEAHGSIALAAGCLCALAMFIPWPQITLTRPLLPEFVNPKKTSTALAWLNAAETGGAALLGPPMVGYIHAHGYSLGHSLGFMLLSLTMLALLASLFVENSQSRDNLKVQGERDSLISDYGAIN